MGVRMQSQRWGLLAIMGAIALCALCAAASVFFHPGR